MSSFNIDDINIQELLRKTDLFNYGSLDPVSEDALPKQKKRTTVGPLGGGVIAAQARPEVGLGGSRFSFPRVADLSRGDVVGVLNEIGYDVNKIFPIENVV
ncbi:MAG: hypothetical protein HW380_2737 [Magnetococcales bacterium]|nr:hypothetical protein [Magnetococcales bacterium]HIJ85094.1 hypothetical protein [Magnetococcales bacterium]